jgi:hypothetical protein
MQCQITLILAVTPDVVEKSTAPNFSSQSLRRPQNWRTCKHTIWHRLMTKKLCKLITFFLNFLKSHVTRSYLLQTCSFIKLGNTLLGCCRRCQRVSYTRVRFCKLNHVHKKPVPQYRPISSKHQIRLLRTPRTMLENFERRVCNIRSFRHTFREK